MADDDDDAFLSAAEIPCDTMVAIRLALSRLPPPATHAARVVLKKHLYTMVDDRTLVDRQLDTLRRDGHIIVMPLTRSNDESLVVLTDDYHRAARRAAAACTHQEQVRIIGVWQCSDSTKRTSIMQHFRP